MCTLIHLTIIFIDDHLEGSSFSTLSAIVNILICMFLRYFCNAEFRMMFKLFIIFNLLKRFIYYVGSVAPRGLSPEEAEQG